jgi:hypothetical protein
MENFEIKTYLEDYNKNTYKGTCKACTKPIKWSRDAVIGHKRQACPNSTEEDRSFFQELADRKKPRYSFEFSQQQSTNSNPSEQIQQPLSQEGIDELDALFGDCFYRTGIAFRIADSDVIKRFVQKLNPAYAPHLPSSKKVSGILLDKHYNGIKRKVDTILSQQSNLILITDGWTNIRSDHIVNFCVKSSDSKTFFYKSIDTKGLPQNARNISDAIIQILVELGPEKFSQVLTDNPPVMKACWQIIEAEYPHISCNGCTGHGLNLLIKDICSYQPYNDIISKSSKIIQFVRNHHKAKAKYDERRSEFNVTTSLLTTVPTRWLSQYQSAESLQKAKYVLLKMYAEDYDELKDIEPSRKSVAALNLMGSTDFWDKQKKFLDVISQPSKSILQLEADGSNLSSSYYEFTRLYSHFDDDEYNNVQTKIKSRLNFMTSDALKLAYILTPKYAAEGFFFDDDKEAFMMLASKFIEKTDPELSDIVQSEMVQFVCKMSNLSIQQKALYFKMNSQEYWSIFGKKDFPNLHKVAHKISIMIASSAASERVWSIFRFIHSRLRNRLSNEKLDKLIFIYINCAIFDEKDKNDYFFEEHLHENAE